MVTGREGECICAAPTPVSLGASAGFVPSPDVATGRCHPGGAAEGGLAGK
jgi:hypothetical protein